MQTLLVDVEREFQRHKDLADRTMARIADDLFFQSLGQRANAVAHIVKHLAGNLISRWTDFLTTDGDKPGRNRDGEFVLAAEDTRSVLMDRWELGWRTLFRALASLSDADLSRTVTIRGEPHTVHQALLRGMTHAAYHVGQILYIVRCLAPDSPWLTIAPGESGSHQPEYLR